MKTTSRVDSDLISSIYEAALEPDTWSSVLTELRLHLNASAFSLFAVPSGGEPSPELLTHNIDPEWSKAYQAHWWQHDQWMNEGTQKGFLLPGLTLAGSMLVEPADFKKGIWFNEALRPQEIGDLLTTLLWKPGTEGPQLVLSFYRSPAADCFGQKEIDALHGVSEHLRRALAITLRGAEGAMKLRQKEAILNGLTGPLLVLDAHGRILWANGAAEEYLGQSQPTLFILRGNRLVGLGRRCQPSFGEALDAVGSGPSVPVLMAFEMEDPLNCHRGGSARLMRLPPARCVDALRLQETAGYLLAVETGKAPTVHGLQSFARLFGLTPAELNVLTLLVKEASPSMIAEQLGVKLPTVRAHLQSIRQKTGTHRFADLVQMALTMGAE